MQKVYKLAVKFSYFKALNRATVYVTRQPRIHMGYHLFMSEFL